MLCNNKIINSGEDENKDVCCGNVFFKYIVNFLF